ncbi:MAG: hypothetical protein IKZ52_09475 [Bacteroidales bacterium]|nr:hypothetical protein [Bacteroidales bacterium]
MKKIFILLHKKQQEKVIFAAALLRTPYEYRNIVRLCCKQCHTGTCLIAGISLSYAKRMAISLRGTCLSTIGACFNGRERGGKSKQQTLPKQ